MTREAPVPARSKPFGASRMQPKPAPGVKIVLGALALLVLLLGLAAVAVVRAL